MSVFKIKNNNSIDNVRQNIDLNRFLCIRVGDYKYSSANSDVNNWLLCDGRSLPANRYQSLYDVIGTSFGSDEIGYFSLPDYRGRVPGVIGSGVDLTPRGLGDSIGEETHILTIPEMPTHQHTGTTDSDGTHTHGITDPGHTHTYLGVQSQSSLAGLDNCADNNGAHTHTFTTQNTGGSNAHNNMQPTLFGCNVFIFSKLDSYDKLSQLDLKIILEY